LASSGAPLAVWLPETTHALLPMPSPVPSRRGTFAVTRARDRSCGAITDRTGAASGGRAAPDVGRASGSKRPETIAPRSRIGACASTG
jgi:hypothetical protein